MKATQYILFLLLFAAVAVMPGCRKAGCMNVNGCNFDPDAKVDDGLCIDKGQVTFWQDSTSGGHTIIVTINATETLITSQQGPGTPLCDASGCATFSLCPGSHNYTANEVWPGTKSWTGDVTSMENGCTTVILQ